MIASSTITRLVTSLMHDHHGDDDHVDEHGAHVGLEQDQADRDVRRSASVTSEPPDVTADAASTAARATIRTSFPGSDGWKVKPAT